MAGQIQVFQKWLQEHGKICPQNMWSSADSVLICTEKEAKGSSSCQQLLKGHIKQHKSYICLTTMSSPLRGLEACFPCCTGECVPEGFAAKPLLNKTARSLRHGHLINHTHTFVEGLGRLYNHDVWILIENQESVPGPSPGTDSGLGPGRGDVSVSVTSALREQGGSLLQRAVFTSCHTSAW